MEGQSKNDNFAYLVILIREAYSLLPNRSATIAYMATPDSTMHQNHSIQNSSLRIWLYRPWIFKFWLKLIYFIICWCLKLYHFWFISVIWKVRSQRGDWGIFTPLYPKILQLVRVFERKKAWRFSSKIFSYKKFAIKYLMFTFNFHMSYWEEQNFAKTCRVLSIMNNDHITNCSN